MKKDKQHARIQFQSWFAWRAQKAS